MKTHFGLVHFLRDHRGGWSCRCNQTLHHLASVRYLDGLRQWRLAPANPGYLSAPILREIADFIQGLPLCNA